MTEIFKIFLIFISIVLISPTWFSKRVDAQEKFSLPTSGTVSSGYGTRKGAFHTGIDFLPDKGLKILAVGKGLVIHASTKGKYGKTVIIYHGKKMYSWYCHLNIITVNVGDTVEQGKHIAEMGSSGQSTGTHLHFEIRVGLQHVNPVIYLKAPLP